MITINGDDDHKNDDDDDNNDFITACAYTPIKLG